MTELSRLAAAPAAEQAARGYQHTLREILQQPETWMVTGQTAEAHRADLEWAVAGVQGIVLTGSGSSQFIGECVRLSLQQALGVAVQVSGGGELLTHGARLFPPARPCLMLHFARSGDSPESTAVIERMLASEPDIRHLVITCNVLGKLATQYGSDPRVRVLLLDDRTNDRSLVMTSSFTNMALAALALPGAYQPTSTLCPGIFESSDEIARVARLPISRVMFLGSGSRLGAARESALKMLEMTAGRIGTMAESYLGLRHGPMSYLQPDTLIVCFLSSNPALRGYETDLIEELNHKKLGLAKLFLGDHVPAHLTRPGDAVIDCPGLPVLCVVAGQLLGFFRCLAEGLQPDSPSQAGVINRVVGSFRMHPARA